MRRKQIVVLILALGVLGAGRAYSSGNGSAKGGRAMLLGPIEPAPEGGIILNGPEILPAAAILQPVPTPDPLPTVSLKQLPPEKKLPTDLPRRIHDKPAVPEASEAIRTASGGCREERFWFTADYLLWWMKNSPVPAPLITLGDPGDRVPGALGQPGTQVLYGGSGDQLGAFSGVRLGVGFWLDRERTLALEATGFLFERRTHIFNATSDAGGTPHYAIPIYDAIRNTETAYLTSSPGVASGLESAHNSSRLWGFDVNFNRTVAIARDARAALLLGYRQLQLDETLELFEVFQPLVGGFNVGATRAVPGETIASYDRFSTRNQFYGGQIGARVDWDNGIFDANLVAKIAFGAMHETVDVDGGSILVNRQLVQTSVPGGILALPSNMGHYSRNVFTVVPEVGVNIGMQLTRRIRAKVGYSFLYVSNVARPGNQIDRVVNPNAVPTGSTFGAAGGPPRPNFTFNGSDYWAHGLNFGIECRY